MEALAAPTDPDPAPMPGDIPPEAIATLMEAPAGRRELSRHSITFFDSYYCQMRWAEHRERWLEIFGAAIERGRDEERKQRVLFLAPRDHGKTEALITIATWAICLDRDVRILWISKASAASKKRVRRIKTLLKSEKVQRDWCVAPEEGYGPFRSGAEEENWTKRLIYVARERNSVDPTLEAIGARGSITGGHFDIIIFDDLEDDDSTHSAATRKKTKEWFYATVGPMLTKSGAMIGAGTRKHHDDLYASIKQKATWRVLEDKGIIGWPDHFEYVFGRDEDGREIVEDVIIEGECEVLWPEERPADYLLCERYEMGSRLFAREMQNQVQDDSSAPVKWEWLEFAKKRGVAWSLYELPELPDDETLDIVQGWDLALVTDKEKAESKDRDYTAGITWGRTSKGDRHLLGLFRGRGLSPGQMRTVIRAEYLRFASKGYAPRVVALETNAFGALYHKGLQETTDLPLTGHATNQKKADPWEGIPSLEALFENGKVVFHCGDETSEGQVDILCQELWGLGREAHDDTVLALWIAELQVRRRQFKHRVAFGDEELEELDELYEGRGKAPEWNEEEDGAEVHEVDPEAAGAWKGLGWMFGE